MTLPASLTGCAGSALLRSDFQSDPLAAGWESGGSYLSGQDDFRGRWAETGGASGRHCLAVQRGLWQTPAIPVQPLEYYQARFASRADRQGFYVFRFFDADGRELTCDEHNAFDASPTWRANECYTQARENAASMRLAFCPGDSEVWIDDVTVSRATEEQILGWSDRLYRTLPPVRSVAPPDRWQYLAATRAALRDGRPLRVLLLGDSIANDMGNSQFHLLIQRCYPGSKIILLRSIRGGGGAEYYLDHVQEDIASRAPDLVIIAGISHQGNPAAIRGVIEQTRRLTGRPVEFLVMTGAVIEPGMNSGFKRRGMDSPPAGARREAVEQEQRFYAELLKQSDQIGIAALDLRTAWEQYLASCGQPRRWYQRDFVHANTRGKQILGRMLEEFFCPE